MGDRTSEAKKSRGFFPHKDCNGKSVVPGDFVSIKTYPRGTIRGKVAISERVMEVQGKEERMSLVVITKDGTAYSIPGPKSLRKLKQP